MEYGNYGYKDKVTGSGSPCGMVIYEGGLFGDLKNGIIVTMLLFGSVEVIELWRLKGGL